MAKDSVNGKPVKLGEQIYVDVFDKEIVLTDNVRDVILQKHPEVEFVMESITDVLRTPEEIRQSTQDDRAVLYYRPEHTVFIGKWIVIVVKQIDRNFISTIYVTDKIKSGEMIWKK